MHPFAPYAGWTPGDVESVRLELSTICQLRCPLCPTGRRETKQTALGWGQLPGERFRLFLQDNPKVRRIEFSNYGEVFLNPDFVEILRIGHEHGIEMEIANGANLNTATQDALEAVVIYGIRRITVSIDGASNQTYQVYRKGGTYENVIANVRAINSYKEKHRSEFPALTWQFVVFGHNEHELPVARRLAADLNMGFRPKMSWDKSFSPIKDPALVGREIGRPMATKWQRALASLRDNATTDLCRQLWENPQVNWDGSVMGCCVNYTRSFGNVFQGGLEKALADDDYKRFQAMVLGRQTMSGDMPCATCQTWHQNLKYRYVGKRVWRWAQKRLLLHKQ